MNQRQQYLALIRHYRDQTGETELDMHKVAEFALARGMRPPKEHTPVERIARALSTAAGEEYGQDGKTGLPYRVYHAYPMGLRGDGQQLFLWVDIRDATSPQMHRSITHRRDQIIGDVVQLSLDAEHWNRINPEQEALVVEADFGPDVEWRRNEQKGLGRKGA